MGRDRSLLAMAIVGLALLTAHVVLGVVIGEDYTIPVTIIGAIGATIVLRGSVGQALARRIQGEGGSSELPPETVLNELEELRSRVLELEERVDFSERLLAKAREGERAGS
jgi:tetrahydromethanopterin S-methyltransferase subunit G